MFRFNKIRPRVLATHLIVTLLYPVFRAVIAETDKALIFIDSLTIVALVLVIGGVIYALFLHGDFDISGYLLKRGLARPRRGFDAEREEKPNNYFTYLANVYEKREEAFNYPLWLGIFYLLVSFGVSYLI